jgi:hypothetical protein
VLHDEIRGAVRRELRKEHGRGSGTLYRYELGICLGETRVDVAAINGRISGYEIKGDRDRLDRLERQISLYNKVLDTAVLVTEDRFAAKAADVVPPWWGLWKCSPAGRWPTIEQIRPSGTNPELHPFAIAQLLWRDEAYEELLARELAAGLRSATRWRLWETLAGSLSLAELGEVVRARLRARQGW